MIGIDCGSSIRHKDRVRINTCGEIFSSLLDSGDSNSVSVWSYTKRSPANEENEFSFTVESLELFVFIINLNPDQIMYKSIDLFILIHDEIF